MPGIPFRWPDGTRGILCTRGAQHARRCVVCHRREGQVAMQRCGWPLTGPKAGQTCDRPVCVEHASPAEPDGARCPAHACLRQHPTLPLQQEG